MSDSDDDAPVGYTKMEAPSSSPSPPQQASSPPPQSSSTSPKPAATDTSTTAPNNTQGSSGDPAAGKLSTAERIKLSVAALITGRDDSVTPAPDHFMVLPGEAHTPHSRSENFAVRQNAEQPVKHAIRHGLTDSERQWGREGLLGSKTKRVTAGGAAADAKRKLSAHLGMSAGKGGEGEQQSCEYVAMNTPCESPVAEGSRANHEEQQWGAREENRRNSTSTHSSSSRTGLVTRLGSALQSWTSGGNYSSKSWGGGGSTAAREGRPGPLGAKYTQQAPESYSPFEPSPHHQLQTKLPVKPAFTAAATARREEIQGEAPDKKVHVAGADGRSPTTTTADALPLTTSDDLLPTDEDGPGSPATPESALTERGKEGPCTPQIDGNSHSTPSPRLRRGSPREVRSACSIEEGESGAETSPIPAGSATAAAGDSNDLNGTRDGDKPVRKAGLWELKAERSRLENALAEAEADRDVEKARAWEAANRLEAAVTRLEGLLEGGGTGGGPQTL